MSDFQSAYQNYLLVGALSPTVNHKGLHQGYYIRAENKLQSISNLQVIKPQTVSLSLSFCFVCESKLSVKKYFTKKPINLSQEIKNYFPNYVPKK